MWNLNGVKSTLAREIERRMAERGLQPTPLSKSLGLNESFLRNILSGKSRNPRADNLGKIAAALGCTVNDLLHPEQAAPAERGDTSSALLARAAALAARVMENRAVADRAGSESRIQAVIYDVLLEAERSGRTIGNDDNEAYSLSVSMIARMLRERW